MLEPATLATLLLTEQAPAAPGPLAGKRLVITAGPTREPIDPVRYISNHSSGKMGYAIARAAAAAGARVVLISGPVNLPAPDEVEVRQAITAEDMLKQSETAVSEGCDIF